MKLLVTGNLGFVGSVVTAHLQALGHEVVGLDAGYFAPCEAVAPVPVSEQIIADVRNLDALPSVDGVVHLAALSNDPLGEMNSSITHDINVGGSIRIAEIAKAGGVGRFVFASSCSMYGVSDNGDVDETSPQSPQTAYAKSKVDAEAAILAMESDSFAPISLRFATAYGFSARPRLDIVVNNLIACALARKALILESDGSPWRPLVHVEDMARAIAAVVTSERTGAFNVGCDDENYQVKDIAAIVSRAVGDVPVTLGAARGADTRSYRVKFQKFADAFPEGVPVKRLPAIVAEMVAAYGDAITAGDYDGDRFFRLRWIKRLWSESKLDPQLFWTAGTAPAEALYSSKP